MQFWDIFSATLIGVVMYPVIQFLITYKPIYLLLLAGIIITDMSTKLFKYQWRNSTWQSLKRPQNAKNCDILCRDGYQGGSEGMPSGHMAVLTFALVFIYMTEIHTTEIITLRPVFITFACVYIILMAFARYIKKCHTEAQIIAGVIWGAVLAYSIIMVFRNMIQ